MTRIADGAITADVESGDGWTVAHLAIKKAAEPDDVRRVLEASENDDNGRSQFVWIRLANGDLCLAVFPQGDLYCDLEKIGI